MASPGVANYDTLLFIVGPFVVALNDGLLILNIISVAVLVAASYALSERKHLFIIAIALSALSVAGTGLLLAFRQPWESSFRILLLLFSSDFFVSRYFLTFWAVAALPLIKSSLPFASIC